MAQLSFLRLEERDCPAIWTDDGGYTTNFQSGYIFDGYRGQLNSAAVELPGELRHFLVAAAPSVGGGPRLKVGPVDTDQQPGGQYPIHPLFDGFVFEPSFRGGVSVALGDVNGDGNPDVIVGAQSEGGPRVRVLDGHSFSPLADFFAFAPTFTGGVTVAAADINNDGRQDVIVAAGVGGGPHVRYFSADGSDLGGFMAGDPADRLGVSVAAGDVLNFDGVNEIVTLRSDGVTHAVSVFSTAGDKLAGFPVLTKSHGSATIGVGYYGNSFVPHPLVAAGGVVESWDAHPLFPTGRLVEWSNYNTAYQRPVEIRVGTLRQLDGVARYDETGATLSTPEVFDARWPLTDPLTTIYGGAAIGPEGHRQTGTLTGYVRDDEGVVYGLTNRHVIDTGGENLGAGVRQPGGAFDPNVASRRVGVVTSATNPNASAPNYADVALFRLDDQSAFSSEHGYYTPDNKLATVQLHGFAAPHKGQLVYKFGFWGVNLGLVINDDATVQVKDGDRTLTYKHQSVVVSADAGSGWIQPGDSGSLVTDQTGLRVGQAFAGSSTHGIFSPLSAVFAAVDFHGAFVDKTPVGK